MSDVYNCLKGVGERTLWEGIVVQVSTQGPEGHLSQVWVLTVRLTPKVVAVTIVRLRPPRQNGPCWEDRTDRDIRPLAVLRKQDVQYQHNSVETNIHF